MFVEYIALINQMHASFLLIYSQTQTYKHPDIETWRHTLEYVVYGQKEKVITTTMNRPKGRNDLQIKLNYIG